jgi:PKD repeat protein
MMDGVKANTIHLTDTSKNTTLWYWTFGDGNFTGVKDPSHTYNVPGVYTICLVATNDCGSDTLCEQITIGDVGLENVEKLIKIRPAPHPMGDWTVLMGSNTIEPTTMKLRIFDQLGRDVSNGIRFFLFNGEIKLLRGDLVPGTYMLIVEDDNKRASTVLQEHEKVTLCGLDAHSIIRPERPRPRFHFIQSGISIVW